MSLKLNAKTFLFRFLDMLPETFAFKIYHFIQNNISTTSTEHKIKASHNSYKNLEHIVEHLGISIAGKKIVEIGSGWLPLMPYFFKYFGEAEKIHTYDLNKHYNPKAIKKLNQLFSAKFGKEVKSAGNKYHLPEGIEYFPRANLVEAEQLTADLVFSRFVLEHVNPKDMGEMHKKFKSSLKPGSYIIHFISPSDHRAYVDKSLAMQDFLKYSEEEWQQKQTKFDYHNRWRLPQYKELFTSLGFEIVHMEYDVPPKDSIAHKNFKKLDLHEDFKKYSQNELMAGSINVVLKV